MSGDRYTVVTPPAEEPLTLQECKDFLRVSGSANDALITRLLRAAREHAEAVMDRSIITQTIRYERGAFCDRMFLPRGRVRSVTSVKYVDSAGTEQTLAASQYTLLNPSAGASYIVRAWEVVWPTIRSVPDAVRVTYVAGYEPTQGSPTDLVSGVPEKVRTAILKLLQCDYDDLKREDREALRQDAYNDLSPYRLASF